MPAQLAKGRGLVPLKKREVQELYLFQQRILHPASFPIEVKQSDHGLGAFATAPIPTGTKLGGYEGRRFTKGEYKSYYGKKRDRSKLFGIWSWTDHTKSNQHVEDYIDANRAPKPGDKPGDWTSMMNHSDTPNVAREQTVDKTIEFTTNTNIAAGDELFFDYGKDYFGNLETDDSNFSKVGVQNGRVGFRDVNKQSFEPYYFVDDSIFPLSLFTLRALTIDYETATFHARPKRSPQQTDDTQSDDTDLEDDDSNGQRRSKRRRKTVIRYRDPEYEKSMLGTHAMAHLNLLHPNLYIGDIRAATALGNDLAWNVICLTPRCGPFATSLYYHKANMSDAVNGEMSRDAFYQHMDEVIPHIQTSLSSGKNTLVNCHGGINRSASAIAYWAGSYVLPFSPVFHTMTDIMGYIRRQNNDQRNNHPALTNIYFVQYLLDKDSMHERKITIRRGDQCAGLVLETQQDNLKKGLKYSNMFTVESLREEAAALHQQLKDRAVEWNRIAGKFEHNVEEIRGEFQDEDSIASIEQLRQFVMDQVPELQGSTVLPGMTYIRFKNAKHANTEAHTDYDNVVNQRKVVSKKDAPRVRTVWVPLHDVVASQSFLQFKTTIRNRIRGKESFVFEAGDVVVFGLKVKHKGTLQKSDKWRLSMDFRVLLPESSSNHVYYKGITASSAIDMQDVAFMETSRKWHVTTVDGRAVDDVCAAVANASTITFSNRPVLAGGGSGGAAARIVETMQTPTALVVEYEVYNPMMLTWVVKANQRSVLKAHSKHAETGRYRVELPLSTKESVTLEMI